MRTRFLLVTICSLVLTASSGQAASNVAYHRTTWNGIPVHVVVANVNSPDLKVTVSLAKDGAGTSESFPSMLNRLQPTAAITGTFFCTRSLLPTGDIVIAGTPTYTGCVGKGVCVTPWNTVRFVPYSQGHRARWAGFETVLCAGPTLVQDGRLFLIPRAEGFSDPALFGKKKRTAVGITRSNKLLMVVVERPVYLRTLAKIMLHLGAVDAVDLDGGSSAALYCNGKQIAQPSRRLTNLLVVYDSRPDYYRHRQALAPRFREPRPETMKAAYMLNPFEALRAAHQPARTPDATGGFGVLTEYRIDSDAGVAGTLRSADEDKPRLERRDTAVNAEERRPDAPPRARLDFTACLPSKLCLPSSEPSRRSPFEPLRES